MQPYAERQGLMHEQLDTSKFLPSVNVNTDRLDYLNYLDSIDLCVSSLRY